MYKGRNANENQPGPSHPGSSNGNFVAVPNGVNHHEQVPNGVNHQEQVSNEVKHHGHMTNGVNYHEHIPNGVNHHEHVPPNGVNHHEQMPNGVSHHEQVPNGVKHHAHMTNGVNYHEHIPNRVNHHEHVPNGVNHQEQPSCSFAPAPQHHAPYATPYGQDIFVHRTLGTRKFYRPRYQPHRRPPVQEVEQLPVPLMCKWVCRKASENETKLVCSKFFWSSRDLGEHITREHIRGHDQTDHSCYWDGCDRTAAFTAKYKLVNHIRVHTGEKPFICQRCAKKFARTENLKIHVRTHTGEKPFACSEPGCNKTFANSSDRKKHSYTHQKDKPYGCPKCKKAYTHPSSMRKHYKTHTEEENANAREAKSITPEIPTESSDTSSISPGSSGTNPSTSHSLNNANIVGPPNVCVNGKFEICGPQIPKNIGHNVAEVTEPQFLAVVGQNPGHYQEHAPHYTNHGFTPNGAMGVTALPQPIHYEHPPGVHHYNHGTEFTNGFSMHQQNHAHNYPSGHHPQVQILPITESTPTSSSSSGQFYPSDYYESNGNC